LPPKKEAGTFKRRLAPSGESASLLFGIVQDGTIPTVQSVHIVELEVNYAGSIE
jgi:hypothetical protein